MYAAQSWARDRRVITRLEYGGQGKNPRSVATNLAGVAQELYADLFAASRGAVMASRLFSFWIVGW